MGPYFAILIDLKSVRSLKTHHFPKKPFVNHEIPCHTYLHDEVGNN